MKKIKLKVCILMLISLLCNSCNRNSSHEAPNYILEGSPYTPFSPDKNCITYEKLLSDGFIKDIGSDVPMLEKQINDSVHVDYLIRDDKVILETYQMVVKDRLQKNDLQNFATNNNAHIVSTICEDFEDTRLNFFVASVHRYLLFECTLIRTDSNSVLSIQYRFPEYYNY